MSKIDGTTETRDVTVEQLEQALVGLVEGDLSSLPAVSKAKHIDLLNASKRLPELVVSRASLLQILRDWHRGASAPDDVQKWASFVRRGYVAGQLSRGLACVPVDYDEDDEDMIVEIISRLDEIGDIVDGYIDRAELTYMLSVLKA